MTAIIPITHSSIGGAEIQTVNARELHAFLEVGKDFSTWIKSRIDAYDFVEGRDFVREDRSPILGSGNRGASIDYHLTLDMAKELAMVERNERGKQARAYFIECERRAKEAKPLNPASLTRLDLIRIAMEAEQERLLLETRVEEMRPKVEAHDRIANTEGSLSITEAAKTLQIQPKQLFGWLRTHEWIYRRPGSATDLAYQSRLIAGLLEHKTTVVTRGDGSEKAVTQARVTSKGLTRLAQEVASSLSAI